MMIRQLVFVASITPLIAWVGCDSGSQSAKCVPDATAPCTCPGGLQGFQGCTASGTLAACVCTAQTGGAIGGGGSGGRGGGGGSTGPASTSGTGGLALGQPDAGSDGKPDTRTSDVPTVSSYLDSATGSSPESSREGPKDQGIELGPESGTEPAPESTTEPTKELGNEFGPERAAEPASEPSPEPGPEAIDAGSGTTQDSAQDSADAPTDSALPQGWVDRTNTAVASTDTWPILYPFQEVGPMVFDASRKKTVMFCNQTIGALAPRFEAVEWDGSAGSWVRRTWTQGGANPARRNKFAVAYDAGTKRIVLVGGDAGNPGPSNETLEWDGATGIWTGPTTVSPGRWRHAMAYDESTGRVVLFGGEVYQSGSGSTALNDVQEYDGVAGKWTNRTPYPLPTSWPQARMDHAMAYDPSRGKIVMCGGVTENGSGFPNEIWDWDSTQGTWTNRTLSPLPANGPGGCPSNGLAYSGNGMMAVFTGSSATSNFYRWDGVLGTWTNMAPSPLPTAWPKVGGNRLSTHLVWDSGRSTLVLTGALELQSSDPQIGLADIWEWTAP